jgi:transcriptional regulator with XRE-family HTH domain
LESIHDPRYEALIEELVRVRKELGVTQEELANRLRQPQSFVSKVETRERRLDCVETLDWCRALECSFEAVLQSAGFFSSEPRKIAENPISYRADERHSVVVPIPNSQTAKGNNIQVALTARGKDYQIILENTTTSEYSAVERFVAHKFATMNQGTSKNREVISECLVYAMQQMPRCNPSDVYHHIVYRLFLREYNRTDPNQSWVRAGGEAVELFIQKNYEAVLRQKGIIIRALIGKDHKQGAINEMGLSAEVSSSKLDIGLWGRLANGKAVIFGGIHAKASLAERVVDDIPASQAMMKKGLTSILFTFDAKSFPPPYGDLVNRGEFGSVASPSDKRVYIEQHGSFDVALCYNTRIEASPMKTPSGKRILVSTMSPKEDLLPNYVASRWKEFLAKHKLRPLSESHA